MLLSLLATVALFLTSNALSLDSSVHLARHQHVAARHPAIKRSVSARCQKRNSTSPGATSSAPPATHTASPTSSSHTPPQSSSPSSGSSGSSGSSKRGISWSNQESDSPSKNFVTDGMSFTYNWNAVKPTESFGLQYIPMLWGNTGLDTFDNVVKPGYATHVFAFNEPDIPGQANLDPSEAANIWMQHGQPLKAQGYTTITPAVAFEASWLQDFFTACKGCQFDIMAAHSYSTDAQTVINYLTELHDTFGMPIWVTEFACQDFNNGPQATNIGQVTDFMTTLMQWMDSTEWIEMYFYYGFFTAAEININPLNAFINPDGVTPTALGKLYLE